MAGVLSRIALAVLTALVFSNPSFVDEDGELSNLLGTLDLEGVSYSTTTSFSPPDTDVAFVVPELEVGAVSPTADQISEVQAFVSGGGIMLICGDLSGRAASLLNSLFGTSLSYSSSTASGSASRTTGDAADSDSPFSAGPDDVPGLNAIYKLSTSSVETSSFVSAYGKVVVGVDAVW